MRNFHTPISAVPYITLFLALLTALTLPPLTAQARKQSIIIRDTEIENAIKEWMEPLKKANNLENSEINIILVQNGAVNAFVAGGANIFLYTGLIEKTETPEELIGVIAHEMGHIAGGHLISSSAAMEKASYESIIGMILGIGAAALSGNADVAKAVSIGANSYAASNYLAHSRLNESAADQSALTAMNKAGIDPQGLVSFLKTMESDEYLPASRQTEYVRTHPITHNRIRALTERAQSSEHNGAKLPAHWYEQHKRMKAKLLAFIDPGSVPWHYSDRDKSIPARYARAIAAYRQDNIETALEETNALIELEPDNPYFYELKGQMLLDFGRVKESIPAYKRAVDLLPSAALIRTSYAHALMESNPDNATIQKAVKNLQIALQDEGNSSTIHRLLATAYGRLGEKIPAKLHLAEEALLKRQLPYAKKLATEVKDNSAGNSKESIQAKDILTHIDTLEKRKG